MIYRLPICWTRLAAFSILILACGTVGFSQPVVQGPHTSVYLRVTGAGSLLDAIDKKLNGFLKAVPGVELITDPTRAKYVVDVNVVQLREQEGYSPVIAISVVTLRTSPRMPFVHFIMDRWGEIGPLGILRAFIRKEHLVTLSTHRLYTTSIQRVTQTCSDIITEFDQQHIQTEFQASQWVLTVVNEAATTASTALKRMKALGERTAGSAARAGRRNTH